MKHINNKACIVKAAIVNSGIQYSGISVSSLIMIFFLLLMQLTIWAQTKIKEETKSTDKDFAYMVLKSQNSNLQNSGSSTVMNPLYEASKNEGGPLGSLAERQNNKKSKVEHWGDPHENLNGFTKMKEKNQRTWAYPHVIDQKYQKQGLRKNKVGGRGNVEEEVSLKFVRFEMQ